MSGNRSATASPSASCGRLRSSASTCISSRASRKRAGSSASSSPATTPNGSSSAWGIARRRRPGRRPPAGRLTMRTGSLPTTEGRRGSQRRLQKRAATWVFPETTISGRHRRSGSTPTIAVRSSLSVQETGCGTASVAQRPGPSLPVPSPVTEAPPGGTPYRPSIRSQKALR